MASMVEIPAERGQREAAAIRIFLLGGFRVERDGVPVPDTVWRRPQPRMLVKLLAAERTHRLHREQIAEIFWPDRPLETAAGNLRKLLFVIRQALPLTEGALIGLRDDVVGLDREQVWIDAEAFEEQARAALAGNTVEAMEAALGLYGGELLPEERYESWAAERREEVAALHRQLLLALAQTLAARGERATAIDRLQEVLALDRADETAHRELMRLYAADGKRREALRQYEFCRAALAEELGVEPDQETESLRKRIEQGALSSPALPPAVTRRWTTPLIGRERALDLVLVGPIRRRPDHAGADRPGLVLIRGEAGVGKTRLAAEAVQEANRSGCLVLWGTCHRHVAYGPVVEALEQRIGALSAGERAELAGRHLEIARILPSLDVPPAALPRGAADTAGHDGGDELRLFAAIARLLTDLAALQPLVLVLDDLHLADEATVALLGYLARLPSPRKNWLLLATYRVEDARADSALGRSIATLLHSDRCRQVDLLQLARRECDRLIESILGAAVDERLSAYIFRTALGNPLFVVELLGALRANGDLVHTEAGWRLVNGATERPGLPVPGRVADLIGSRISSLDEETRRLLALAAVAGMSVPYGILERGAELAELTVGGLLDGLDAAVEARVLLEDSGESESRASSYSFQHPLFREAVYERLSAARRAHLHGVVARAIEDLYPNDLEGLAYHYVRSGNRGQAITYLERAGDRARSIYANAPAESHYRSLLSLLEPGDPAIPRVQAKLAAVLNVTARHDEALALLESAGEAVAAAGEQDTYGQVLAAIGMTHAARGTPEAAASRLENTLARLDGSVHAVTLAGLALALAHAYHAGGRYADSLLSADRAGRLVGPYLDDPDALRLHAQAEVRRAAALERLGRTQEARRVLQAAMPEVEAAGDLDNLARAVNNLAYAAQLMGDFAAQQRYQRQALEIAERLGDPARIAVFRAALGQAAFFTNDWNLPESLALAEQGYRELKELGASWHVPYAAFYLGWILFSLCRLEEARPLLEEAVALAGNDRQVLCVTQALLSYADFIEGEPAAAAARLEPLVAAGETADDLDATLVCAALAHRLAALGERGRAMALGERAVRHARAAGYPLYILEALFGRGIAAIELGCWERAEADLTEALALARDMGYAAREAALLAYRARLEAARGNCVAARRLFAEARALCVRLGGQGAAHYTDLLAHCVSDPDDAATTAMPGSRDEA